MVASILSLSNRIFGNIFSGKAFESLDELVNELTERKFDIMCSVGDPHLLDRAINYAHSVPAPEQAFRIFALGVSRRHRMRIGLLIDQFEMLPVEAQFIFHPLLKRENLNAFFTIIASRPFALQVRTKADGIQQGEDFHVTVTEYLPENRDQYVELLADIWRRLRPRIPALDDVFEGGVGYFADLSSRSIRLFFRLCTEAGALEHQGPLPIRMHDQAAAARRISAITRDGLKTTPGVPEGQIWRLITNLCRTEANGSAPGSFVLKSGIEHSGELSSSAAVLLRKSFEESALQFTSQRDTGAISVPHRFCVAPIVGPILDVVVEPHREAQVSIEKIEKLAEEIGWMQQSTTTGPRIIRRGFLSVSFASTPEATTVRDLLAQTFEERGLRLVEGSAIGPGMIGQLEQQIRDSDFTILVLSDLRPNIMVEMGISIGLKKQIMPLLSSNSSRLDLEPYPFLMEMGRINYNLTLDRMIEVTQEIVDRARAGPLSIQLLEQTMDGTKIRVRQKPRSLGIYYPRSRAEIWERINVELAELCKSRGWEIHIVQEKPHREKEKLSLLEHLIWTVSLCEKLIIDTTGIDGPDMYGAFALGFARGMSTPRSRKSILRTEEMRKEHPSSISMWPGDHYKIWQDKEEILATIAERLPARTLNSHR
jgi:hypothetical protein